MWLWQWLWLWLLLFVTLNVVRDQTLLSLLFTKLSLVATQDQNHGTLSGNRTSWKSSDGLARQILIKASHLFMQLLLFHLFERRLVSFFVLNWKSSVVNLFLLRKMDGVETVRNPSPVPENDESVYTISGNNVEGGLDNAAFEEHSVSSTDDQTKLNLMKQCRSLTLAWKNIDVYTVPKGRMCRRGKTYESKHILKNGKCKSHIYLYIWKWITEMNPTAWRK